MWTQRLIAISSVAALLGAAVVPAAADDSIDSIEHFFGATNINAITGHGRLAAGVSEDGDVTVLSWPSPAYSDHLGYLSSNDFHARSLTRLGAPDGAGMFLGLLIEQGEGHREVSWLRDRTRWEVSQSYGDDDGPNIVTRHASDTFGLTVAVTDAVRPPAGAEDVLVRSVTVERTAESPVTAAWLLTYANLSPTTANSRLAELPVTDWLLDGTNDFAAIWDASAAAVMHFHPADQLVYTKLTDIVFGPPPNYGPIGAQLKTAAPDPQALAAIAAGLDDHYAAGTYIALTTRPAPDQHQIGYDATPLCGMRATIGENLARLPEFLPGVQLPIPPEVVGVLGCGTGPTIRQRERWLYDAADAFLDAADGDLQGSDVAAGEVNEALRTPLAFTPAAEGSVARASVVLGFAPTAAQARTAVLDVGDPDTVAAASSSALNDWLAGVRLPVSAPAEALAVARRSLINLRVGTDLGTGAIVASISRQPPYYLDWPRDGMFFNAALDVSGQSTLAGRRADLYITWQRRTAVLPTPLVNQPPPVDPTTGEARTYPADAWEMNYHPDGLVGGPIRFEIDNTALALWMIVSHVGWTASEPSAYLTERWDPIRRGTNLLARWRDPLTGLQAPASEDDNLDYTQSLHGAVTVFGALDIAARAARLIGRDGDAARWEARACELRNAIGTHLYDAEAQRFVSKVGNRFATNGSPTGDTAWLVWPTQVLPWDDERIGLQMASDLDSIGPTVRRETRGGAYFLKTTTAAALARGTDPALGPIVAEYRDLIAETHATPLSRHFGESMLVVEDDSGRQVSQRVANPHLWEGILFYLTAMALEDPGLFDRHNAVLPASQVPPMGEPCPAVAVCGGDCDGDGTVTVDELLVGVNIALDLAPATTCSAVDSDGDGVVTVDELVRAVRNALNECAG